MGREDLETVLNTADRNPPVNDEPTVGLAEPPEGLDDGKYLHGLPLALMVFCLMVGVFTIALDSTIIATAIPKITNDFDSLSDVAVAGLGAAGLFCGGMLILSQIVEMRRRPLFLGIITSINGVAMGAVSTLIFCFYYPASSGTAPNSGGSLRQKLGRLGFRSAIILIGTLVCLILALQWGGTVYPWSDSRVWGCFLGFCLLLALFGFVQFRKKDEALIPLRILSQRSVLMGCTFAAMIQGGMMTQAYHLPFYFQAVKGVNAQESGVDILPHGVTVSIATLISGTLITVLGYYVPFMWLGSALFVTGGGLLSTLSQSSSLAKWFGFEVLAGFGYGLTVQVPVFAAQVVLNAGDLPIGTTLVLLFQCLGGAIGLAISQNVFQNLLHHQLGKIEGVDVTAVIATGGVDLQLVVAGHLLDLVRNAFQSAVAKALLVSVGVGGAAFVASLGMEMRRIKAK
ncbi:major facilitator superfamily domain-containing protein [Thelonectria olida]|uniref:Major facilitator superfamily domain-containing protein n=1 Tax=Thelonectria olida TaxID=1576542 RepID=A0A9P8VYP2_9HYPO|nr:major facilitator superfamily domain-containing protein [Thelonectria olida]